MGGGVDAGGGGEGAAEGEGRLGAVAGWSGFLGGYWELAGGREGGLNGWECCQCMNGDSEVCDV